MAWKTETEELLQKPFLNIYDGFLWRNMVINALDADGVKSTR